MYLNIITSFGLYVNRHLIVYACSAVHSVCNIKSWIVPTHTCHVMQLINV